MGVHLGRQALGALAEGSAREWLVADGLGGYAMGTASGLRTRRYHGLLVPAVRPPGGRMMGLAALDPVLVRGGARVRLGVHEWADGTVAPRGHEHLDGMWLRDGLPCWRWTVGDVVLEREVAMAHGRPLVAVVLRVVRAPGPVRVEAEALCTWRDVHGERHGDGDLPVRPVAGGFVVQDAYRVRGPGYAPGGAWYRGVRAREEAARGLAAVEDLWFAGTFGADVAPGGSLGLVAWAGDPGADAPPAEEVLGAARARARVLAVRARAAGDRERMLAQAADAFVVDGPAVVAGYPWFGEWSRDALTAYEGLLLETGRQDEGRALLLRAAGTLSEGMLANTTDSGAPEYNTADGTLWLAHAAGRHVERTGDHDLAAALAPALEDVLRAHVAGTRYGIRMDPADGLLAQGAPGMALTWMDARVDGVPVTQRAGKPVEVNGLWVRACEVAGAFARAAGRDPGPADGLAARAGASFARRFAGPGAVPDVVDGPGGDDRSLRPNALVAAALPGSPLATPGLVRAARASLLTPLGLRSLAPGAPGYRGRHRGAPGERDAAYHQGTVWPWPIAAFAEAALRAGEPVQGVLDGLLDHLGDFGLGSVSETADGDPPHAATGCPFQAWSVAEVLRAVRLPGVIGDGSLSSADGERGAG